MFSFDGNRFNLKFNVLRRKWVSVFIIMGNVNEKSWNGLKGVSKVAKKAYK